MSTPSPSSVVRQILGVSGFQALGQMVSFLGIIVYTRLAPKWMVGSFFLFIGLARVLAFLGSAGTIVDLTRKLNQSSSPDAEFSTAFVFLVGVSTVLVGGVLLFASELNTYVGAAISPVLALFLPVEMLALLYVTTLKGEQKNIIADFSVTARKIVMYGGGTVALYVGVQPITAMVGAAVGSRLLHLIYMVYATDARLVTIPGFSDIKSLLSDIGYPSIVSVGDVGQEWIDTLLIGVFLTQGAVATYEIAWRFSGIALILTNAVSSVLYPRLSEMVEKGDYEGVRTFGTRAYFYTVVPILALIAGGFLLGEQLLGILYGEAYLNAYVPLIVLLAARLFYTIRRVAVITLYGLLLDRQVARISLVAVLMNVLLNIYLIPLIGIVGAAIGSLSSFVILALATAYLVDREAGFKPPTRELLRATLAATSMFFALNALQMSVSANRLVTFGLVFVGGVIFFAALLILSPIARSDFRIVVTSFRRTD